MRRRFRLPSRLRQPSPLLNLQFAPMTSPSKTTSVHEALPASEHQSQLLVQGVKDYAIFMLDPQGRITTWNSGAERIKGYEADEIIGEHFSRFYTEEDQREGVPAEVEFLQRSLGETIEIEAVGSA